MSFVFNVPIGVDRTPSSRIETEIDYKTTQRVSFLSIPLFHPRLRRDAINISSCRTGPQTRSDRVITCKDWTSNFVGKISPWIDCDNGEATIRKSSELALISELAWSNHLGLKTVLLTTIKNVNSPVHSNYIRTLLRHCSQGSPVRQNLVLPIPMILPLISNCRDILQNKCHEKGDSWDGWYLWNSFRSQMGYHTQLSIGLILSDDIYDYSDLIQNENFLSRWVAEPIKMIIIPTSLFQMNDSGFPVLSKLLQKIIRYFMKYSIGMLLTGKSRHISGEMMPYVAYLRHLQQREESLVSAEDKLSVGFWDALQAPLQPLMDNLESQTYETFEQDPIKYAKYEDAIAKALRKSMEKRHNKERLDKRVNSIDESKSGGDIENKPLVVMVVGAGRGPLVAATLAASASTDIRVQVYAVEKNPNAVITLRNRVRSEHWQEQVTVISEDMRRWDPPEMGDILVSELLGSFGDNELSPECLDSAQKLLLKPDGVSVPERYTAFLQPISCPLHWMAAREMFSSLSSGSSLALTSSVFQGQFSSNSGVAADSKGLETPYVVKFHRFCPIDAPRRCWEFIHPNQFIFRSGLLPDNTRYIFSLTWLFQ